MKMSIVLHTLRSQLYKINEKDFFVEHFSYFQSY